MTENISRYAQSVKKMNKLYNIKEVAAITGYAVAYVRLLLREGKIVGIKPGGGLKAEWRVTRAALDAFLCAKDDAKHNRYLVVIDSDGNFAITDISGYKDFHVAMTRNCRDDMAEDGEIKWAERKREYKSSKELSALTEEAFVRAGAFAASLE